jgi:hypothetical protein
MRRLLLLGVAICLVGWLAWYAGMVPLFGTMRPAMSNPEDGKVANGIYTNDYFGLSYPLPEGWAEGLAGPEPSHLGYYALRTLIPHDELDGTILIAAQDMFFADKPLSNAVEAASDFRRAMSEIEGMTIDREPLQMRIADHTVERVDFSGVGLYRAMFVTEARCHLVSFNLTARDPERLARLTLSVNSLSFADRKGTPVSAPACVKNYAVGENLLWKIEPAIPGSAFTPIPVRITIGVDGKVKHVHVIRATADQRKSIEHVLAQWQFRPYAAQGRAVEVETGLVFHSKQMGM